MSSRLTNTRCFLLIGLSFLVQNCALNPPYSNHIRNQDDSKCVRFFQDLDQLVKRHQTGDAGAARIAGFPHLRTNRFLASLADQPFDTNTFSEWIERLRQLDERARRAETTNLPADQVKILSSGLPTGETIENAIHRCGKRLSRLDIRTPGRKQVLLKRAQVNDHYQTWKRFVGIYPLTRFAAKRGVEKLHGELSKTFDQSLSTLPIQGRLIRYRAPETTALNKAEIRHILRSAYDSSVGTPQPESGQLDRLFQTFAPVWEIDTHNSNDQIGRVQLSDKGRIWINTAVPAVYRMHDYARFNNRVLLQLIYLVWLPAREKTGVLDLYGGNLDSVIWRVTLNAEGEPIAFDSIHSCGCYYLLFPGSGYRTKPPGDGAEPVLSPIKAPEISQGKRLVIRLASRTHYIQQVYSQPVQESDLVYQWKNYDNLRLLEAPNKIRRSLFRPDGIVIESQRSERFFLWPFGILSPGAMRQWGTHAISFIGRRHFDDPLLLEKLITPE